MSDNVTPIGPAAAAPPPRRVHTKFVKLEESPDGTDFSTANVITGLQGICEVLYRRNDDLDVEEVNGLAAAARVLSTILRDRFDNAN